MTAGFFIIAFFVLAWLLLTASLVLLHIAHRDGIGAIAWAVAPTIAVLALSYLQFIGGLGVTDEVVQFAITGGLFVLTGVLFSKAVRLVRQVAE